MRPKRTHGEQRPVGPVGLALRLDVPGSHRPDRRPPDPRRSASDEQHLSVIRNTHDA